MKTLVISLVKLQDYHNILKKIDKPIAFVLGRYLTGGLGVVRNLGRNRVPVIWLDSNPKQIGFLSKYCKGIICPHPKNNLEEYIDFLINIGKKLNFKGVLLPIGDIEVYAVLKNRKLLENYYHIPMADFEVTQKLLDKKIFYKTLQNLKIEHPKTYFPKDVSEVEKMGQKISYPCILKPSYSAHFVLDFKSKLFRVKSSKQLIQSYKKAKSKNHDVVIQEIIPGQTKNMHGFNAYYDRSFAPYGVFMYRRIREWPHDFGNGCFIESIKIPELEGIISLLVKKIKYYGIVDAEFKKDLRDNKFKLIEINPRCWMQNSLPTRTGVNIPYMTYLDATGNKIENTISAQIHMKWIFMPEDIYSSLKSMKKNKLTIKEWLNSLKGEKEYAVFSWDDPTPFFVLFLKLIFSIFIKT